MSLGLDESKSRELATERVVDANYRTLRIIWLAILASVAAIFVVTRIVQATPGADRTLFWILLALGVSNFGASFLLKHKLLGQGARERKPELVRGGYIAALALCESIGIFGLIVYLVTGMEYYYFFFVISGFGILLHKPQRDDLLAAAIGGATVWEAKRND